MKDNGFSDKMKSAVSKTKGELKDQIGNATNDTSLQAEGKMDKLKGEAQEKIGELKDRFSDTE
ncbi:CsbD family protein [Sporosarcina sp. 179-K 3D1 HS]|uniref:CsbD family protein n=1 Tax=Sporosarcina sp. 179-K 3D1 HS TaxID=3232169 RepID=UPI0039A23A9B